MMSQVLRDMFATGCFGKLYSLIVFHSYLFCFLLLISFWIQRAYIKHQCLKFPDFCRDIQRHIWIREQWWPGWAVPTTAEPGREGSVGWVDIAAAQVHHPRVVFLSWKPAQNGAGPSSRASHSPGKGLAQPELWQEQHSWAWLFPPSSLAVLLGAALAHQTMEHEAGMRGGSRAGRRGAAAPGCRVISPFWHYKCSFCLKWLCSKRLRCTHLTAALQGRLGDHC